MSNEDEKLKSGSQPRVVLITPARDEEAHLPSLIASLDAQTYRPALWIIVDDGSSDDTLKIALDAAETRPWMTVVRNADRGKRLLGSGVVDAFYTGLRAAEDGWDFIGKLDADITFSPDYLRLMLEEFERNPKLGSASGKVYRPQGEEQVEEFMIDEMVAGQWKLYRRACFEDISGLVGAVMWDGIDFHSARQAGWQTRSISDPRLRILHHRQMGSSDRSILRGRLRLGRGQWFMGSHPLYMLCSAIFRMAERPRIVGGLWMLAGYVHAAFRLDPRYERPGFRRELHRWQLGRLKRMVLLGGVR